MKLSELIEEYGDENVRFQMLDTDGLDYRRKKNHNEITFGTSEGFNIKGTEKMCLIIWLDRDRVKEIQK